MYKEIILILSIILNIIFGYILFSKKSNESNPEDFTIKIDSLESELANIENKKDSVNKEIDTVFIKLKVVEKEYEEKYNNVLTNSTNDDYVFFTDYLNRNKERLDSINNLRTIKEN